MPIDLTLLDRRVKEIALAPRDRRRALARVLWQETQGLGIYPASIAPVYRALAEGRLDPLTTPAVNVRGLTYAIARCIWRTVLELDAGPVVFELAPVEMQTGDQTPDEYTAMVFAAAAREGYRGPVFLQGDHLQIVSPASATQVADLCRTLIECGWYQIDIDGSPMADPGVTDAVRAQGPNARATAAAVQFIRSHQPAGVHITVGGEVGEIGGRNTSVQDVDAFMSEFTANVPTGMAGLDKFSAQTGTIHGGLLKPDGTLGKMPLDVALARTLALDARRKHGLLGLVQHGASTLGLDDLALLPDAAVIEVHLATGVQNVVFDHPAFPRDLLQRMRADLAPALTQAEGGTAAAEAAAGDAVRFYRARWQAWGQFKNELWSMPESNWSEIASALESWFAQLFRALRIAGRRSAVSRLVGAGGAR